MFYIREILFRIQYFLFSFILTITICYFNKNLLLFLLTFSILTSGDDSNLTGVKYFIYTHPSELFTTYILIVLYFSCLMVIPKIGWHIFDFLKSSLSFSESRFILRTYYCVCLSLFFFNIVCFIKLFPKFWLFFETFNFGQIEKKSFNFFLELRITDYLSFLSNFLYAVNVCLFFLLVVCFLFCYSGLKTLLHWKKLFIFLNIVFATLLSPPDVYSQLLIFTFLTLIFELIFLLNLFYFKVSKYVQLLVRHHIK
jgi:Sec-independent protein secretion pathway component TatC